MDSALVVDNYVGWRRTLYRFFEGRHFEVVVKENEIEAMEAIQGGHWSFVCTDLKMIGDCGGLSVAREAARRDIPAAILTVHPDYVRDCAKDGEEFEVIDKGDEDAMSQLDRVIENLPRTLPSNMVEWLRELQWFDWIGVSCSGLALLLSAYVILAAPGGEESLAWVAVGMAGVLGAGLVLAEVVLAVRFKTYSPIQRAGDAADSVQGPVD